MSVYTRYVIPFLQQWFQNSIQADRNSHMLFVYAAVIIECYNTTYAYEYII